MTLSTGNRPSVWEREVLDTETADGVVGVVRDYLTLCKPDELEQLPGQCAPSRFEAPEDVVAYAILVREAQASTPRGERAPLDKAGDFVVLAARRIGELQPRELEAIAA
jgi:hypothetical protein